jgi:outer membrane protease
MLAINTIDREFEPWSGLTKDHKIGTGIYCFSSQNTPLRSKNKDWLAHNQDNVSEWSDMSTHERLFW